MNHAAGAIGIERIAGSAGGEVAGGVLLPALALAADFLDLDMGVALGDGPERRSGFNRLKLLGIANQDHLGATPLGLAQHPFHLA